MIYKRSWLAGKLLKTKENLLMMLLKILLEIIPKMFRIGVLPVETLEISKVLCTLFYNLKVILKQLEMKLEQVEIKVPELYFQLLLLPPDMELILFLRNGFLKLMELLIYYNNW